VFCLCQHERRRLYTLRALYHWELLNSEDRKAVDMSYGLVELFEFWDYSVTFFDKETNSGGIFAEYVNMFLKLKQESSGFSSWV